MLSPTRRRRLPWGCGRFDLDLNWFEAQEAVIRGLVEMRCVMREDLDSTPDAAETETAAWKQIVAEYQNPSLPRALWQIANTLLPYALLWYLMYLSLAIS